MRLCLGMPNRKYISHFFNREGSQHVFSLSRVRQHMTLPQNPSYRLMEVVDGAPIKGFIKVSVKGVVTIFALALNPSM